MADATIEHNIVYDNTAAYRGAGVFAYYSTPNLNNNTIVLNRSTYTSSNSRGAGIYVYSGASVIGHNNILYFNTAVSDPEYYGTVNLTYSCVSTGMNGTGNITGNPMFADTANADFHLTQTSPCIDTGDPGSPLDPDSTRADMGALYFNQSSGGLSVTLTPHNPPVQIPAAGGGLTFDAAIQNTSGSAVTVDAWTEVVLPSGNTYGPLILRNGLSIPNGATVMRTVSQSIPGTAPAGNYSYVGKIGIYPGRVEAQDEFPFVKFPGEGLPSRYDNWTVTGWDEGGEVLSPDKFITVSAYPNPFNQHSLVSLNVKREGYVELAVYDISGREVAQLAEGWHSAGIHQFTWNAAGLSSGVYFIRADIGGETAACKALLIK